MVTLRFMKIALPLQKNAQPLQLDLRHALGLHVDRFLMIITRLFALLHWTK